MKEQNELEQLFSSAFDGFEVAPPSHLKAAIDESLFAGKIVVHKKHGFIWLFPLIGLFFIGSLIAFSFNTPHQSKKSIDLSSTNLPSQQSQPLTQDDNSTNTAINQLIRTKKHHSNNNKKQDELAKKTKLSAEIIITPSCIVHAGIHHTKKSSKHDGLAENSKLKKNTSNRFSKKSTTPASKRDNSKQTVQKSSERSNVIGDFAEDKLNDKTNLTGLSIDKISTVAQSTDNTNIEETPKEIVNEKQEDVVITYEKQKEVITYIDSTKTSIQQTQIAPLAAPSKWTIGLYAGTILGVNSLTSKSNSAYEINTPAGFGSSIEVNYGLSGKWSVITGFGYAQFNERISGLIYDTTLVPNGVTVQYVYSNPVLQDSIIDSIIVVNYITEISASNAAQKINYSVFSLPIYGSFSLFNKGNWNSSILAGVRLNYTKTTVTNYYEGMPDVLISTPEIKQFGISAALRPEITYSFGKFGLGVYLNTSFDLIPITRWSEFDKKRFDLGGGVLLKYRF